MDTSTSRRPPLNPPLGRGGRRQRLLHRLYYQERLRNVLSDQRTHAFTEKAYVGISKRFDDLNPQFRLVLCNDWKQFYALPCRNGLVVRYVLQVGIDHSVDSAAFIPSRVMGDEGKCPCANVGVVASEHVFQPVYIGIYKIGVLAYLLKLLQCLVRRAVVFREQLVKCSRNTRSVCQFLHHASPQSR